MPFAIRLISKGKKFAKILDQSNSAINEAKLDKSFLSLVLNKKFDAITHMLALLTSTQIPDSQLETVITTLRTYLLKVASSLLLKEDESNDVADLAPPPWPAV